MSSVHALSAVLAADGNAPLDKGIPLPLDPIVYGVGAFVLLCILLLIVLTLGRGR